MVNILGDILSQEGLGDAPDYKSRDIGNGISVIDGDTVNDSKTGQNIRIQGVDTLETSKVKNGLFEQGDLGGDAAANVVASLTKKHGFNKPVYSGEVDSTGSRQVGDLVNEKGERLSDALLRSGLADTTLFSSQGQINSMLLGRLDKAQRAINGQRNDWDIAGDTVRDIINTQQVRAKPLALTEQQLAANPDIYSPSGVSIRSSDRNLDNTAKSSIKTAWAMGTAGAFEGAWGALDIFEDAFGLKSQYGEKQVQRLQREIQELPELKNLTAFDEEGNWRIDGALQFADYVFTNAAASAPYMLNTIVATLLAPVTFGVSLASPALVYSGQTYNEQKDKNIATAITSGSIQAALDFLGFKGVSGAASGILTKGATRDKVVKALANQKFNGNVKVAEAQLAKQTMREMARISKAAKAHLAKQLRAKYIVSQGGKALLAGGAAEAITETLQELTASLGENNFNIDEIDSNDLKNRLLNAAVAGGVLGGGISGVSQVKNTFGAWDAVHASNKAPLNQQSKDFKYQQDLKREGRSIDIEDVLNENVNSTESISELAKPETKRRLKRDIFTATRDVLNEGLGYFWRGQSAHQNAKFGDRGSNIRAFFAITGGNKIYHGNDLETAQHLTEAQLNNELGSEAEAITAFKVRKLKDVTTILKDADVSAFLDRVTKIYDSGKGGYKSFKDVVIKRNLDLQGKYAGKLDAILEYGQRLDNIDSKLAELRGTQKVSGQSRKEATINKETLYNRRDEFVQKLLDKKAVNTREEANSLADDILDLPSISQVDDAFDALLRSNPTVNKSNFDFKTINQDPDFAPFFENDIFYNAAANRGTAAARYVNDKYIGKDGAVLASLLKKAHEAGEIDDAELAYLAQESKDFMEIRSGEYKRIQSPLWRSIQNYVMFATTLNALPLAALSSVVELALVTRTVSNKNIFSLIVPAAKQAALEMGSVLSEGAAKLTKGRVRERALLDSDRRKTFELGFFGESQTVARKHDINLQVKTQRWINAYFKLTGLQPLTNMTRTLRLSLAGDAIKGWVEDVAAENGGPPTVKSLEAREALINLGVDIETMVDLHNQGGPLTPEQELQFDNNFQRASYRFVNDAVANPTKGNRPKFYQNPRTALFFQFQGFIATFSANILPKLLAQPFEGTVANRLNAISTIATLLFLGFFTQYLRDLLKYGEPTPYLDNYGKFQRALGASGLLGVGERVLNTINPLYDTRHDNWVEEAIDAITHEAPALGYTGKLIDTSVALAAGEFADASKKAVKAAPLVGPYNRLADWVKDSLEN